jgi:hypothetical protein
MEGPRALKPDDTRTYLSMVESLRGRYGALAGEAPPAGWTPITPDPEQGTVAGVPDERSHWFAAPFLVSEAESSGRHIAQVLINVN